MSSIPHLFRCPISLDLFADPVTLCTGQTYDRTSIETWLAQGHLTCPVTMQTLHDTTLVPNHTLRHLIHQWLLDSSGEPGAPPLGALKHSLQSPKTSRGVKLQIIKNLRILSCESHSQPACLVQLGFLQVLLELLFEPPSVVSDLVSEEALGLVLNLLPYDDSAQLNMLKKQSNLAAFETLLARGNARIKTSLCCVLEAIMGSSQTEELCGLVGQLQGVWQVLLQLLHENFNKRTAEAATRAVAGLCLAETNRETAVKEGAVDALMSLLPCSAMSSLVLETLEVLARCEAGKRAIMRRRNVVQVLVRMVFRVSGDCRKGSEHAVGLLLILCCSSARIRVEAVNAGVLLHLLLLLQSQCSSEAKSKARALLKILDQCGLKIKEEIYSIKGS